MMIEYTTNRKKVVDEKNELRTPSWIKNLEKNADPLLEKVKLKACKIGWGSYNFLLFSKNVVVHVKEVRFTFQYEFNGLVIRTTN